MCMISVLSCTQTQVAWSLQCLRHVLKLLQSIAKSFSYASPLFVLSYWISPLSSSQPLVVFGPKKVANLFAESGSLISKVSCENFVRCLCGAHVLWTRVLTSLRRQHESKGLFFVCPSTLGSDSLHCVIAIFWRCNLEVLTVCEYALNDLSWVCQITSVSNQVPFSFIRECHTICSICLYISLFYCACCPICGRTTSNKIQRLTVVLTSSQVICCCVGECVSSLACVRQG